MSSDQGTPPPHQATASSSASPLKSPSSSRSAAASFPPPSPIPPPPPAFTPSPSPPPQSSTAKLDSASPDPHASGSASPDSLSALSARKARVQSQPQLVQHLPLAHDAAMATFTEITHNDYHDKKLGRPPGKFDDYMLCDCNPATENTDLACTDESGCINRMTQIECSSSKCRWGKLCRNQRFHRRQYVNVDIVQTEKKGFGLRAAHDIPKESFVYEYVGEVMNQHTFLDRMQLYRTEGIRHFYFMMLQPNEYLDATKKGGKGRFINHSCNPNCSVSKWQVGKHLRMGIFAKRNIAKGEELTFNYNVDRYGNDAQECFCGEPNCVGTLGGKTQTDLSGMDDLFLDALGISDEVEQTEAKGSRRKRGKRLDLDFIPQMRPIQEHEATRVMTAARQAGPKREILEKLLRRMEMTTDVNVQKSLVKLHGFILMQFLLEQWWNDRDIVLLIINVLARWPLIARNKVIDCGIEDQVRTTAETYRPKTSTATKSEPSHHPTKPDPDVAPVASVEAKEEAAEATPPRIGAPPAEDAEVSSRAEHLLEAWKKLDMTYRIARKDAIKQGADEPKHATNTTDWIDRRRLQDLFDDPLELDQAQAPNAVSSELGSALSGDQELRESRPAWQPPPPPPAQTSDPRASRRSNNPLNGSANSFPASSAPTGLTADQLTSALSSSLAKSLPGLVSSLQQHGFQMPQPQSQPQSQPKPQPKPQLKPEPQHAPPKVSAPPVAKSIEEIIREANEHEERARKEAEAAAKAARELELNGNLKPASSSSSSSRKRPSSSSRHADKRHKPSSSAAAARSSNGADAGSSSSKAGELTASNERRLRKLVGEVVVRQMSKHKDALERESFKRHAKELTNVIADKEMRNPKSWPPANGATLTELSSDKKAKMKSFATEYIDKLLARKAKAKVKDTPTTDEPGSSSHPANSSSI